MGVIITANNYYILFFTSPYKAAKAASLFFLGLSFHKGVGIVNVSA